MKTVRRDNGIIICDFPGSVSLATDLHEAFGDALHQLHELVAAYEGYMIASWTWTDVVYTRRDPPTPIVAATHQLLLVRNGAGFIRSGGVDDHLDYGYWVFVPSGVRYEIQGTMISGLNLRVMTVPLR